MTRHTLSIIGVALSAIFVFHLGYRIRVRREWHLIAGFGQGNIRDPDGLGRWLGGGAMLLGALLLLVLSVAILRPSWAPAVTFSFAAAVMVIVASLVIGALRYLK